MSLLSNISRVEAPLRRGYINFRNRRLLSRYVLSSIWMMSGILRTILGGLWNAEQLSRPAATNNLGPILFNACADDQNLCQFMLRLAEIPPEALSQNGGLDVILKLSDGCQPGPYATLARHLRGALNLHLVWTDKDAQKLLRTVARADASAQIAQPPEAVSEGRYAVCADMVGRLRPRQIYANTAREYFKSIDWSSRFCVISPSAALPAEVIFAALEGVDALTQGWRFVWLGPPPPKNWKQALGLVSVPSYSGLDYAMQMALVTEADAYCGELGSFGLAALLAGKPAAILRESEAAAIDVSSMPAVRTFVSASAKAVREELILLMQQPDMKA